MRLAVVGWAADSGVGRELIDALRHLPVLCAFIFDDSGKPTRSDLLDVPHHMSQGRDVVSEMKSFIETHRPDTVLTWEAPGSWAFPEIWNARGIRWIHVVHSDWFAPQYVHLWRHAVLVAPNRACQDELMIMGLTSVLLPVPVDTERLVFRQRTKCSLFLSVYGYGGMEDRRSLPEIFAAWAAMEDPPPLVIQAQRRPPELNHMRLPHGIEIKVGNVPEPADLWTTGDVAVQPSRYEGVGISLLEAQACGAPVITTDAGPMKDVAPDLLVAAERTKSVRHLGRVFQSHVPSSHHLKRLVEGLYGKDISELSSRARTRVESTFSWKALRGRWMELLSEGGR
jgi:glycosyltransferase involved in cell wall biosynthesis